MEKTALTLFGSIDVNTYSAKKKEDQSLYISRWDYSTYRSTYEYTSWRHTRLGRHPHHGILNMIPTFTVGVFSCLRTILNGDRKARDPQLGIDGGRKIEIVRRAKEACSTFCELGLS